jgi:hypothetical protein
MKRSKSDSLLFGFMGHSSALTKALRRLLTYVRIARFASLRHRTHEDDLAAIAATADESSPPLSKISHPPLSGDPLLHSLRKCLSASEAPEVGGGGGGS